MTCLVELSVVAENYHRVLRKGAAGGYPVRESLLFKLGEVDLILSYRSMRKEAEIDHPNLITICKTSISPLSARFNCAAHLNQHYPLVRYPKNMGVNLADLEQAIRNALPITHLAIEDQSSGCGESYAIVLVSEVRLT